MKQSIFFLLLMLFGLFTQGQSKPRKPPTQQEMDAMKAQMQKAMDKLTPEQRKQMEEMGIRLPTGEQLDNALAIASANPDARGGFPKLNAKKIAAIPATPTAATLPGFLGRLNNAVESRLGTTMDRQATALLEAMKEKTKDPSALGKGAVGFWLAGKPEWALLVTGKLSAMDPSNAENLNNYAALLTMMDAQHMAVPVLQFLDKTYPGDPTILANLGQAWFGLGDIKKSEQYLDSALRIFPKHSQANNTKSQIQEERGDKKGAAESLEKSLETGYEPEKEERLRRLGYPVEDVSWPFHIPQDPLGFNQFSWPEFPLDVEAADTLRSAWEDFRKKLEGIQASLTQINERLETEALKESVESIKAQQAALKSGQFLHTTGPLSLRAARKLGYLLEDKDGGLSYKLKKMQDELMHLPDSLRKMDSARNAQMKKALDGLDCGDGEGSKGSPETCCRIATEINNQWLRKSNVLIRETYSGALDVYKKYWSALAYFYQYGMEPMAFAKQKSDFKLQYLAFLLSVSPNFHTNYLLCEKKEPKPFKPRPMAEFDDINCQYHSYLDLVLTQIETHCSKMKTTFNIGEFISAATRFQVDLKASFEEDLNKGVLTRGSADMGFGIGSKTLGKAGPVKAEVSASGNTHIEFNGNGITEVVISAGAKAEVKTDMFDNAGSIKGAVKAGGAEKMKETGKTVLPPGVGDKSVTIGEVKGAITINAGSGVTGSGTLSGLQLK